MRGDREPKSPSAKFLAACQHGQLERLKSLAAEHGIRDWRAHRHKSTGDTGLHLAAREGHLEVARYLCEDWLLPGDAPGAVVDVANYDMKRPLHEASQFARSRLLRYLVVARGAEVDALKRADWTPLMLACARRGPEALECVELLLGHGANPRLRNKDGWTALLLACRAGEPEVVRLLLSRRSAECLGERSNNGRSAAHVAAFHARRRALAVLLEACPGLLEARDSAGCTPLLEAAKSGELGVARDLIERGAEAGACDSLGQNLLHVAASVGNLPVIRYALDELELPRNAQDRFGVTPLRIAEKNGQDAAAELLINYGCSC